MLFLINPCKVFFLEESNISWDERVVSDGGKYFSSGADVSLLM